MQQALGIRSVAMMCLAALLGSEIGDCVRTNGVNQVNSVITATFGDNVTLNCFLLEEENTDPIVWYKQKAGHEPHIMAMTQKLLETPTYYNEFKPPRFTVVKDKTFSHFNIASVEPSDEAMYYCGINKFEILFGKGTFLSVKARPLYNNEKKQISVDQNPLEESVPPGESVSLQCTVLSERRSAELRVLWFRAAAGDTHPEIIYTHHNSSRQCEIRSSSYSCVYNLSKRVHNLSDTGNYYCAVATCGKIFLGNGTTVGLIRPVDPVIIFLGAALGVCVLVITAQAVLNRKRGNCEHCSVRHHQGAMETKSPSQEQDAEELNYAVMHFSESKTKRKKGERGLVENSVYSQVISPRVKY